MSHDDSYYDKGRETQGERRGREGRREKGE